MASTAEVQETQRIAKEMLERLGEMRKNIEQIQHNMVVHELVFDALKTRFGHMAGLQRLIAESEEEAKGRQSKSLQEIARLEGLYGALEEETKNYLRLLTSPIAAGGLQGFSRGGGKSYEFNPVKIRELGWGTMKIAGQPLIKTIETVDVDVWKQAISLGFISKDEAIAEGAVHETDKTRKAYIRGIGEPE